MEPINEAAYDGDVAAIDRLVAEDGERLNARNQVELRIGRRISRECTPLMLAAYRGQDAAVERLLALGTEVESQDEVWWCATHWACFGKQTSSLALLLDAGASVINGWHLLMEADECGATDCLTLLLARLQDVGEPIHQAAWDGDVAAIDRLVAEDAKLLNAGNQVVLGIGGCISRECTPLMLAAFRGQDAVVKRLLALGADVGLQDEIGWVATHWACFGKQSSSLALLLDAGASMTARNKYGKNVLMAAADYRATDCVKLLIARLGDGVEEQLGMLNQDSAGHFACRRNHPSTLALLLDVSASTTARDRQDRTLLMTAAQAGASDCVTLLLGHFGDGVSEQLGMVNDMGDSATPLACYFHHPSTLALLLDAGASMTARNNRGQTPLIAAVDFGATDCVKLLLEKFACALDLNAKGNGDWTALHLAAYKGHHEAVSLLLYGGADPTICDRWGETPLETAQAQGHHQCVPLLEAALVEPQRPRALFKARALLDAAYTTRKARTDARAKGHPAAVQEQEAIAAAPVYLKQRVAQAQGLPRVSILLHDDDEEEKLMACVKYALGFEGGGGVVLEWQEEPAVGMLPEVFVELLEMMVSKWDPAQKGRPLGEGYIEVEEEEEEDA